MDLVEINDNEFLRQFEMNVDGHLARIEYSLQERKIFLTKFDMSDDLIEDGYKEPFIKAVFDEIRERGISLVPTSPEIAGFMRANRRKYKELLPVGINI